MAARRNSVRSGQGNDNVTPLPKMQMACCMLTLTAEASTYGYLYPFIPFMVRSFGDDIKEEDVGFHSGWIASSFMIGQFLSSFVWGYLSDRIGLRPVVLCGSFCCAMCTFIFGFSTTLAQAMTIRLVGGLLNGNVGVVKTMIGLISDETNEAIAFGQMALCWGIGSIIGPAISGILSEPADRFPSYFSKEGLFGTYPYLLPCIATAAVPFSAFILGFNFLIEPDRRTRAEKGKDEDREEEEREGKGEGEGQKGGGKGGSAGEEGDRVALRGADGCAQSHAEGHNGDDNGDDEKEKEKEKEKEVKDGECKHKKVVSSTAGGALGSKTGGSARGVTGGGRAGAAEGEEFQDSVEIPVTHVASFDPFQDAPEMELNSDDTPRGSKPGMSGGGQAEMGTGRVGRGGLRRGEWHGEGKIRTGGGTLKRGISFQNEAVMGWRGGQKGQKAYGTPLLRTYPSFFGRYSSEKRLDLEGGGGGGGGAENEDSRGWFVKFILSRGCVMSILIYCLLRFSVIALDDVMPLFMSTPRTEEFGGLGWNTGVIGWALLGQGAILVCHVYFIFPIINKYFGPVGIFRIAGFLCPVVCVLAPALGDIQDYVSENMLWVLMQCWMFLKACGFSSGFTSVTILINNSAPKKVIGTVNGVAQTCASLASAMAPAFAGNVFSYSLQERRPWPWDFHLVFYVDAVACAMMLLMSYRLPASINTRYDDREKEEEGGEGEGK